MNKTFFRQKNHALLINLPGPDRCSDIHLQRRKAGISTDNSFVFCHLLLMKNLHSIFNDATLMETFHRSGSGNTARIRFHAGQPIDTIAIWSDLRVTRLRR